MNKRFFQLMDKVLTYHPNANTKILKKAYTIAAKAHMDQRRATNEPYIIHPLAVAWILADLKLDEISIAAGLLHDIVEDTPYTIDEIKDLFGEEISNLVWGVTKISKISSIDSENAKAETIKRMIVAMSDDVRVILIKLADRLHNTYTLEALTREKRKRIASETLDIYAPIAYRLGMGKIKNLLEDISFQYAFPKDYKEIDGYISRKEKELTSPIHDTLKQMKEILKKNKIKGQIHHRVKRPISIYRKLLRQNVSIESVYDLLAFRIITDTVEHCYTLMGEMHQTWRYIPSRWRDHINNPKANGYRSIHTTVINRVGNRFEIQIRTREMDKIAEEGIAAHWRYKGGISFIENDKRLDWFREMINTHKHNPDPTEFLSLVKGDLAPDEIYVFTPKGKIINLKSGATPIDFAYAIHTEVGDKCQEAIVNEHLVPLKTKLVSGDVVEIVTSRKASPNIDWLKYVVTTRARKKITAFIQKKESSINLAKGKRIWNRALQKYKKKYQISISFDEIEQRIDQLNYSNKDEFFRDLGSGRKVLDKKTLRVLFPEFTPPEIKPIKRRPVQKYHTHRLVKVEGYDDIDIVLAKCCNPIKGEKITGYITQNRGLVIHRHDCVNLKNAVVSRLKTTQWNKEENYIYLIKYELIVEDTPGILSKVSAITAEFESNIRKLETERITQNTAKINVIFEVSDLKQLNLIYKKYKEIKGVFSVVRKRLSEK